MIEQPSSIRSRPPPPLASYAGSIRPEQHRCIQVTLPPLQATLRAADQLLFSTSELADRWRALERKAGRDPAAITVWPNLIPPSLQAASRRPRKRPARQALGDQQVDVIIVDNKQPVGLKGLPGLLISRVTLLFLCDLR